MSNGRRSQAVARTTSWQQEAGVCVMAVTYSYYFGFEPTVGISEAMVTSMNNPI